MIKEIQSIDFDYTDAALAFLCTLLHGNRPEETCGTKWKDFNFKEDDYHIQNAYKKIPIYDEISRKQKKEALQGVQKQDMQSYLGSENKNLTHLQNNININNKNVSNLEEIQKDDLKSYLQLNDDTLKLLKQLIIKISEKEKASTQ